MSIRFWPSAMMSGLLGAAVFGLAPEAHAACVRTGNSVECSGLSLGGFLAPTETMNVHVAPDALVQNIIRDERIGSCGEPALSEPAINVGAGSTVVSEGSIFAGGVCGWGIAAGSRSSITNAGTLLTDDTIGFAVVTIDDSVILNTGRIQTTGLGGRVVLGNDRVHVTNAVGATMTVGNAPAIDLLDNAVIINHGTITSGQDVIVTVSAPTITNTGTLTTSAQDGHGIRVLAGKVGTTATITNAGTINAVFAGQSNAFDHGAGIDIFGNADISNAGNIAGSYMGVHVTPATAASITNTGTISAVGERNLAGNLISGGGAIVIHSDPAARVTITNEGRLVAAEGTPAVLGGDGIEEFTNTGIITGDVRLGGGNDDVRLLGGTVTGAIDGGSGSNTLFLSGLSPFGLGGPITNFAAMTVSDARWTLNAPLAVGDGADMVRQVVLLSRSSYFGAPRIDIGAGGTLGSRGTAQSAVINGGVVVARDLRVVGSYTQTAAGRLDVLLNGTNPNPGLVVMGPAQVDGTLALNYATGDARPRAGQTFNVLRMGLPEFSLSGTFSNVVAPSTFLRPTLLASSAGLQVRIDRLSYTAAAATRTHQSVAAMLDRVQAAPPAALEPVLAALDDSDAPAAQGIFNNLTSRAAPAFQNLGLYALASYGQTLIDDVPPSDDNRAYRAWGTYFSRDGRRAASGSDQFTYALHGGMAAIDRVLTSGSRMGLAVGVAEGDAAFNAAGDFSATFVSALFSHAWRTLTLTANVTYGHGDFRTDRVQVLPTGQQALTAKTEGDLWSAFVGVARPFEVGPVTLLPQVGLRYSAVHLDGLDEAQPLAQQTQSSRAESLHSEVALRASATYGRLHPFASISWTQEFLDPARTARAQLIGAADSSYTVFGASSKRAVLRLRGGIGVDMAPGLMAYASGAVSPNDRLSGISWTAGLSWRW